MPLNINLPGRMPRSATGQVGGPYLSVVNELFFRPQEAVFFGMGKLAIRKSLGGRRGGGWAYHKASLEFTFLLQQVKNNLF